MVVNPFFLQVMQGVRQEVESLDDVRQLTWQGKHLIPPAALTYLTPDALILGAITPEKLAALPQGIPKIGFSNACETFPCPRIVNDDRQVGEMAARALIDAGYCQLRILGDTRMHHFALRCEGALSAARGASISCKKIDLSLPPPEPGQSFAQVWEMRGRKLQTFLANCPDNTGLLILEGNLAYEIHQLLNGDVRRSVPDEIGLVVADLVDPENKNLAHVLLDGERIGRLCLQTFYRKATNTANPLPFPQFIPARDIVPGCTIREEETQIIYQRLEAWIHQHLRESVTVEDAAAHLGISRRLLEMKLHAKGLSAPYELITEIRMRKVRTLLESSDKRIGDIAEITGFQSARALTNRFRAHHGVSPRAWRHKMKPET